MAGERLELEDRIERWLWSAWMWCFGMGFALLTLGFVVAAAVWGVRAIVGMDRWGLGWHASRGIEPGMYVLALSFPLLMTSGLWGESVGCLRRRTLRAAAIAGMALAIGCVVGALFGAINVVFNDVLQWGGAPVRAAVDWIEIGSIAARIAAVVVLGVAACRPARWRWTNRALVAMGLPAYSEAALMGGWRAVERALRGECIACAYSMAGLEGNVCPECGARQPGTNRS